MISWKNFTGEFPRLPAHALPVGAAQSSLACDFSRATLRGLRNRTQVPAISTGGVKSIFVYDSITFSWFTWNREVDAVRGPIAQDEYARFYWCDGQNFWVSRGDIGSGGEPSPTNRFKVGVPAPTEPLSSPSALNTFNVDGMTPTSAQLVCETLQGTVTASSDLSLASPAENSLLRFKAVANAQVACPVTENTDLRGLAVRLTFSGLGASEVVTLRENPSDSSFPPNLAALTGHIVVTGSQVEVLVSYRNNYLVNRAYTYTYVNQYGEEGPPAPPVNLDANDGQALRLTWPAPPTGHGYIPITRIRIYRAERSALYQFVAERTLDGAGELLDDVNSGTLGEPLSTQDYYPPPQNLQGLVALPNGVLAAFRDNEVHFSVPYLPYAWKRYAIQTTPTRVVGLCPFEAGLYVTTTSHPLLITGVDPDSMTAQKIPAVQAGVAKGAITNVGPYAVYASHDGLVALRGLDANLDLSFKFFDRDTWRERYRNKFNQMRLSSHDGRVIVWFADGTPGFVVRLDDAQPYLTQLREPIYAAMVHPQADELYVSSGAGVFVFEGGETRQVFEWHSGDVVAAKPTNYGVLQLVGDGQVTAAIFADGAQVAETTLDLTDTGSSTARLPGGFLARRWSLKLTGAPGAEVLEANIAVSHQELQSV